MEPYAYWRFDRGVLNKRKSKNIKAKQGLYKVVGKKDRFNNNS